MRKIKVKICGLNNRKDVQLCINCGVDILGFVVDYPVAVPWNISYIEAKSLIEMVSLPQRSCIVTGGRPEKVIELASILRPSYVQLHYKETLMETIVISDALKKMDIGVIKIVPLNLEERLFQFETTDLQIIVESLCRTGVYALLADSRNPSNAEKNGLKIDLDFCRQVMRYSSKPVITAGGITPVNVSDFLEKTGSGFIDIMSGVEKVPGTKDAEMLSTLLAGVREFQSPK